MPELCIFWVGCPETVVAAFELILLLALKVLQILNRTFHIVPCSMQLCWGIEFFPPRVPSKQPPHAESGVTIRGEVIEDLRSNWADASLPLLQTNSL